MDILTRPSPFLIKNKKESCICTYYKIIKLTEHSSVGYLYRSRVNRLRVMLLLFRGITRYMYLLDFQQNNNVGDTQFCLSLKLLTYTPVYNNFR